MNRLILWLICDYKCFWEIRSEGDLVREDTGEVYGQWKIMRCRECDKIKKLQYRIS